MASTKKTYSAREAFIDYLHGCNMRITPERLSIIEVISKHTGLFSIDELHNMMSKEAFPVSTATLYNTIELLEDSGIVKCLRLPNRPSALYRLDMNGSSHIYLICQQCGSIKESSSKTLSRYISKYDFAGMHQQTYTLSVYGLCKKCSKAMHENKETINKTKFKTI